MTGALASMVSVALTALLGVSAVADLRLLAATAALVVLVLAIGWGTLLDLPDPHGSGIVVALSGWGAISVASLAATRHDALPGFACVLALGVPVAFGHEMLRTDGRSRLVESVAGTITGQVIAVLTAGWTLLPDTRVGSRGVVVLMIVIGAGRAADAVPLPARLLGLPCFLAGCVAGAGSSLLIMPARSAAMTMVAVAVAGVTAALDRLVLSQPSVRDASAALAASASTVAAAGTMAYALVRVLVS